MGKIIFCFFQFFLNNFFYSTNPYNYSGLTNNPGADSSIAHSTQMILVITNNWEDTIGTLALYERKYVEGEWIKKGKDFPVNVGRAGLAWGTGLHVSKLNDGPVKHEGDNKAPAGIFRLSKVFGYESADSAGWLNMPYIQVDSCTECVDDFNSKYYNTIIDNRKISDKDWNSSEIMKLSDDEYKWGIVVEHNSEPVKKGAGSCIFIHIWEKERKPTAGCSAVKEKNLFEILHWLNINSLPILVQFPIEEYKKIKALWKLP